MFDFSHQFMTVTAESEIYFPQDRERETEE